MTRTRLEALARPVVRAFSAALVLSSLLSASVAMGEGRTLVDLEPVTPRYGFVGHHTRTAVSTIGVTFGTSAGKLIPYVGGGIGFSTLQLRAGVSLLPNGLTSDGLLVRLEARPQIFFGNCLEPAAMGNLGVGYRWTLEASYPGEPAGAALYVMPAVDGGVGLIRDACSTGRGGARHAEPLLGGTVVLGLDW